MWHHIDFALEMREYHEICKVKNSNTLVSIICYVQNLLVVPLPFQQESCAHRDRCFAMTTVVLYTVS